MQTLEKIIEIHDYNLKVEFTAQKCKGEMQVPPPQETIYFDDFEILGVISYNILDCTKRQIESAESELRDLDKPINDLIIEELYENYSQEIIEDIYND